MKGKPYVIRNRKTGLLLTAGFELKLAPPATLEQIWIIVQTHPAEYELIQVKTGDVLLTKEAEDGILLAL